MIGVPDADGTQLRPTVFTRKGDMAIAVLIVEGGPLSGRAIDLVKRTTSVGRSQLNDIVVDGRTVSSTHAAIRNGGDGYWIGDMGSRTGTFVDDELVGEPRKLHDGDRIKLGGMLTHWVFVESEHGPSVPA
jgi:pSer/pThr/pTyr-binding forkhead associated (FHA) protein